MKVDLTNNFGEYNIILKNVKKENQFIIYLKHMCRTLKLKLEPKKISKRNGKIILYSYVYSIVVCVEK